MHPEYRTPRSIRSAHFLLALLLVFAVTAAGGLPSGSAVGAEEAGPYFYVVPEAVPGAESGLWVDGWLAGAPLTVTIGDPADPDHAETFEGSESMLFRSIDHVIAVGDLVTVTDGETTKSHTVVFLTIELDRATHSAMGEAEPGTAVTVQLLEWPDGPGGPQVIYNEEVTADEQGGWSVDFASAGFVLDERHGVVGLAYDEDGDATQAWPPTPTRVERVAGADRYETAVAVSQVAPPEAVDAVVIATGANWPDALGGSALAGAVDGPLLLTRPAALPEVVADEIARLGPDTAYVVGGPAAVSAEVQAELEALIADVTRLEGADRYGTADAIAAEVIALFGAEYSGWAFVATGRNFPDALAASPVASRSGSGGMPILLTPPDGMPELPDEVAGAAILGGPAAVTPATEQQLEDALGADNVTRTGGADRYETAALLAEEGRGLLPAGRQWDGVGVATGEDFPDALAGGVLLGRMGTVMLLTRTASLPEPAQQVLARHAGAINTVHIFGGPSAVSEDVRESVHYALEERPIPVGIFKMWRDEDGEHIPDEEKPDADFTLTLSVDGEVLATLDQDSELPGAFVELVRGTTYEVAETDLADGWETVDCGELDREITGTGDHSGVGTFELTDGGRHFVCNQATEEGPSPP